MDKSTRAAAPFYVGIDGGGSKCRAFVTCEDGRIQGHGISTSANPAYGFKQATDAMVESIRLALKDAGLTAVNSRDLIVGAGLAGINLPSYFNQMQQWQHPFKALHLTSDVHIACLGAHQGEDGAVLVIGTGSCAYRIQNGIGFMLGGHGFPYGDQGSGAWIGLKVVEAVLLAQDKLAPQTLLTQKVDEYLMLNGEILTLRDMMIAKPSRTYANLAPLAFDLYQADTIATQIIDEGAGYLNKLADKILTQKNVQIALIGGLAPPYQHFFNNSTQKQIMPAVASPQQGAVLYVKQQLATHNNSKK